MKKITGLFTMFVLVAGLAACVEPERRPYAGDSYGGQYDHADRVDIQTRIDNQKRRIDQGISSGELTRQEADVLFDNLNWIRDEYVRAKRDGMLTPPEIDRLSQHLDQNSRMISDKKNNSIRRVYTPPAPVPAPMPSPSAPDIFSRIENQQKRISEGVRSGDLTRREADMLHDNLDQIKNEYSRMKADNRLTRKEIERLENDLDANSRMIQDKRMNQVRRLNQRPSGIQSRIDTQQRRIDEGVRSGELTRREAEILQENLEKIRAGYARMKADGRVSEKEQEKLEKRLDRNDRMIYEKQHNAIERID